jgi:excisionase family DNA binding protein
MTIATTEDRGADLLYGVHAIAEFLGIKQRAAKHLIETRRIPFFKVGKTVCARRARILEAFEQLEQTAE